MTRISNTDRRLDALREASTGQKLEVSLAAALCRWPGGRVVGWSKALGRGGVSSSPAAIGHRAVGSWPCQAMWLRIPTETATEGDRPVSPSAHVRRQAALRRIFKIDLIKTEVFSAQLAALKILSCRGFPFQLCQLRLERPGGDMNR